MSEWVSALGGIGTSGGWHAALLGLAASAVIALLTWFASLAYRDVSLVDRVWSLCIVGAGIAYAAALPQTGPRAAWMLAVAGLWALRLSLYITWRNWGEPEDRRYQAIRARNEPHFALKSLILVFALQAVLAWVVSAPLLAGVAAPAAWSALDTAGLLLAAFGLIFEATADWQMARFKADPAQHGRVMDRGLWRYSRHPNYFGECCVWWGLYLMALAAGGAWSIVSPLLMTVLLLKVSGISLLEKDIGERRPAYRDYVARTNAFVPGPPRKAAS
ncbi:DUF1295 domain-containing protein [Methylibium sp.]|uniref:DUF1295 domain-containing protein n=1 Tax=Methylibium sp. TaxID=2067992 RepID=UPI0025F33DB6|nr:DUF1295 domain-containing protein [Methylibium sp.]